MGGKNSGTEKINPVICFRTGEGYLRAGKALLDTKADGVSFFAYYISPCVVNLAFACELYLKAIYAVENNNKCIKWHSLIELSNAISDSAKIQAKAEYENYPHILKTFDECIASNDKTFEQWRYLHEPGNKSIEPDSLFALAVSLRKVGEAILEKHDV